MQYFRLYVFCKYISGKKYGCIYNMKTHEMISISEPLNNILSRAEKNIPLSQYECKCLEELAEKGLGNFYSNTIYVENLHYGPNPAIKTMITPNAYIRRCYIQLTNECDLNCCFCGKENYVNRRTGCKKWNNINGNISLEEWKNVIKQLKKLGCREICFIGGNPFLEYEKLVKIVEVAVLEGICNFSVYSHEIHISNNKLNFFKKYDVLFIGTIISLQNAIYEKVTGEKRDIARIFDNIEKLIKNQIKFVGNIVIGKFNENEVEIITKEFFKRKIPYKYNIIYSKPWNDIFSEKYVKKMYEKDMDFGIVTKESLSFLSEYNSCLYGQIYINIAGEITPCPMMSYTVGNIRNNGGIVAAISNQKYQNLIHMSRNKITGCKSCAYYLNCFDCRAIEYMATNKIDGMEYCQYSKEGELIE